MQCPPEALAAPATLMDANAWEKAGGTERLGEEDDKEELAGASARHHPGLQAHRCHGTTSLHVYERGERRQEAIIAKWFPKRVGGGRRLGGRVGGGWGGGEGGKQMRTQVEKHIQTCPIRNTPSDAGQTGWKLKTSILALALASETAGCERMTVAAVMIGAALWCGVVVAVFGVLTRSVAWGSARRTGTVWEGCVCGAKVWWTGAYGATVRGWRDTWRSAKRSTGRRAARKSRRGFGGVWAWVCMAS